MKITWLWIVLLMVMPLAVSAQEDVNTLITQGDKFSVQNKSDDAIAAYLEANRLQSKSADILWRLGREYYLLAGTEPHPIEKIRLVKIGNYYANLATKLHPDNPQARLWNAITLQQVATYMMPRERISMGPKIHTEALAVTEQDPSQGQGWAILGKWEMDTAALHHDGSDRFLAEKFYGKKGIPEASIEQAIDYLKKAVSLAPQQIAPRVYLGTAYLILKKRELARAEFEKATSLPAKNGFDEDYQKNARQILSNLGSSYL